MYCEQAMYCIYLNIYVNTLNPMITVEPNLTLYAVNNVYIKKETRHTAYAVKITEQNNKNLLIGF